MKLTLRQFEVLQNVKRSGVVSSGSDGSVLEALEKKDLVIRNSFSQGQNVYYHWSLADKAVQIDSFIIL